MSLIDIKLHLCNAVNKLVEALLERHRKGKMTDRTDYLMLCPCQSYLKIWITILLLTSDFLFIFVYFMLIRASGG